MHTFTEETPHPLLDRETLTQEERAELLSGYVTRGRALRLEGDRGLLDSHRRRALNLGQFFTPSRVARLLTQALGLAHHPAWDAAGVTWAVPKTGSLVDFAGCGNGRLFEFAPKGWSLHGADVDPLACRAAKLIYPEAEILEGSLLDFRREQGDKFTAAIINPPFSVNLVSKKALKLSCAQWGVWGRATSAVSHFAAFELAVKMAGVVGAILPTSALDGEGGKTIRKGLAWDWRWGIRLRVDLPSDAFAEEGTEWPCSLLIVGDLDWPTQEHVCSDWEAVDTALHEWITALAVGAELRRSSIDDAVGGALPRPSLSTCRVVEEESTQQRLSSNAKGGLGPTVRLALGGRAHQIRMKPNCLIAALAIEEARLASGWINSEGFEPQAVLDWTCDLVRNAGRSMEAIREVCRSLRAMNGIRLVVDDQLWNHAEKADKRAAVEMTSFSQWVRRGDEWIEKGKDTSGKDHPAFKLIQGRCRELNPRAQAIPTGLRVKVWDREARAHVERAWKAFPIYAFAQKDIVRSLGKRSSIYSARQGLGKTRFSIGAVMASGVRHALWVLETRLVDEFKRELKRLGLMEHFHQIDSKEDLRCLKAFNVITYSRLWRDVNEGAERRKSNWGPGKSFAAALAKRRLMVLVDEAHKIRSATSKQGMAARLLCGRARRVILLTGTAIQSYPRNILGLVVAGWGDGSTMNPYGYRRPVMGGYRADGKYRKPLIKGVTRFVDEFCDVVWYTPAFEQTASTGMKSREIPRLKNPALWDSFIRSKLIRRVPGEPEVRASGVKIPEAEPVFVGVTPTKAHFAHYKLILDHFAGIWKDRLRRERESGRSENNAAHILPELDALRFASTVPVARHRWADKDPLLTYSSKAPTGLMLEALARISTWVEAGERVVVGAEKPDALRWLADLLADLPKYVPDSDPIPSVLALEANIDKRNAAIDRARDEGEAPVLLISVGMGKEGLNLPEFSKLMTLDLGWVPGDLDQFRHRILRPGQVGQVEIVHLFNEGMIDTYMRQLCEAKSDAISQAIDGQETEFDYSAWKDYRTFALEMLEKEGYEFAVETLCKERSHSTAA